jgi:hypothetical protein
MRTGFRKEECIHSIRTVTIIEPISGFGFSNRLSISALKVNPIVRHGHRQNVTDRVPRRTTFAMLQTFQDRLSQSRNVNSASVQNHSRLRPQSPALRSAVPSSLLQSARKAKDCHSFGKMFSCADDRSAPNQW